MTQRFDVAQCRVIVVTGVPGAGKSTLAALLADTMPATLLSLDAIKEELFQLGEKDPVHLRMEAEKCLLDHISATEGTAVVDIWVSPVRDTDRVAGLLRATRRTVIEVYCTLPSSLAVERYASRQRAEPHVPPDASTLQRIREAADHPMPLGIGARIEVDTARHVDVDEVLSRLASIKGG